METPGVVRAAPPLPSSVWKWEKEIKYCLVNKKTGERYYPETFSSKPIEEEKRDIKPASRKLENSIELLLKRQTETETVFQSRDCLETDAKYNDRTYSMSKNMLYSICSKGKYHYAKDKYIGAQYQPMNQILHGRYTEKDAHEGYSKKDYEQMIKDLKTLILTAPPLEHDIDVFSVQDKSKKVTTFFKQFMSTSIGSHCIDWGSADDICYKITVPAGTPCLVICGREEENEMILPFGTQYEVHGSYQYKDGDVKLPHPRYNARSKKGDRVVIMLKAQKERDVGTLPPPTEVIKMKDYEAAIKILDEELPTMEIVGNREKKWRDAWLAVNKEFNDIKTRRASENYIDVSSQSDIGSESESDSDSDIESFYTGVHGYSF